MKNSLKVRDLLAFSAMLLIILLFLNLLALALAGISISRRFPVQGLPKGNPEFSNPFSGCGLLASNCVSKDCSYYFLCDSFSGLRGCSVYDCGDKYGIVANMGDNGYATKTYPKQSEAKTYDQKKRCQGKLEVVDKKCADNKLVADVKVTTSGSCPVQSFLADMGNKNYIAVPFDKANDIYHLHFSSCDKFFEIIASGEGGVSITQ